MRGLRTALRWLAWILGGLVLLVVLAAAVLVLTIDRPAVRGWLRPRAAALVSSGLGADVAIGDIARIGLDGVFLRDVRVEFDGEPVAIASSARIALSARPALPLIATVRLEFQDFRIQARRDAAGEWNVAKMLRGEGESTPPPSWLGTIEIALARGSVVLLGLGAEPFAANDVGLDGAVRYVGEGAPLVAIDRFGLRWGDASWLRATGWVGLEGSKNLELTLHAEPVAGRDLASVVATWPADRDVTGTVQVTGSVAAPTADVELASGDARVDASASLAAAAPDGARRVTGHFAVAGIDPALVAASAPAGTIAGDGSIDAVLGDEPLPRDLAADVRLWQSSVAGFGADWLTAQAHREGDAILASLQGAAPGGAWRADLRGSIALSEPHAATLEGEVSVDDPAAVLPDLREQLANTAIRLKASASAEHTLDESRVMEARVDLTGSRLRGFPVEDGRARVRVDPDLIDVSELRLRAGPTDVTGAAWLGQRGDRPLGGSLAGTLDVGIVPGFGGVLALGANAWGTIASAGAHLDATASQPLRTPAGTGPLRLSADAAGLGGAAPSARAHLTGRLTLVAGAQRALGEQPQQIDVAADWSRRTARGAPAARAVDAAQLSLVAKASDGREQRVRAEVERTDAATRAVIEELQLALRKSPVWRLSRQATVALANDRFEVHGFELGAGNGRLALEGELDRAGRRASALTLAVEQLELQPVCALAGAGDCAGRLGGRVALAGTAARPDIHGSLEVAGLGLASREYGTLAVELRTDRDLVVDARLTAPGTGSLVLAASLPLAAGWPLPAVASEKPLHARVTGANLDVAGVRAVAPPATFTELRGRAQVDVDVSGTLSAPRLAGAITVDGLDVGLTATGATLRGGRIAIGFDRDAIELRELSASGGALHGGGRIDLAGGRPARIDLRIDLARLTVIDRSEATAQASGAIQVAGTFDEPAVTGKLVIDPATIRPSLVPGRAGARQQDPTIVVIRSPEDPRRFEPSVSGTVGQAIGQAGAGAPTAEPSLWDRTRIAVDVTLGDQVAIRRTDADIRLTGAVYATKAPRDDLRLTGQVVSTRGWFIFQNRRLELEHAYVSLSGETPITPYIDVRAVYRSPQYRIVMAVQGTLQQPTLDLSSQPPLDQSDILSVLLFGKPSSELTSAQGEGLQRQAVGLLASYVAPELEKSIVDTFGLASITFQMPTGSTAGTVGVGRYIGNDIFVSIGQDFGGPQGGTPRQLQGLVGSSVTVQYYLTPTITLQGAASSQGESAIDVIWQKRY